MHFVSGIKSGGVEQMLINYTEPMNRKYHLEEIIVYQHEPNRVCLKKLLDAKNKCIRISDKNHNPIKNISDTFRIIKKEKPDIIHAHMNLLNFIPLFCGLVCGVKVRISHSHIANKNIKFSIAEKLFKKLNLLFSNELLSCGYKAGKYMYGNRRFEIVYNSIDIDKFIFNDSKRKVVRKKLGITDQDILIGNVGRLTEQKNQKFLIEIMRELVPSNNKFKLIIFGSGELKKELSDYINLSNLEDNIKIHNPVNNIEEYYDAMDVFLLPSLYEGFPVSLVEAQANGLSSLVSNTIDKTSAITDKVEFLSISSKKDWVDGIINLQKESRKININEFINFDIKYSYKSLANLYIKLASNVGVGR